MAPFSQAVPLSSRSKAELGQRATGSDSNTAHFLVGVDTRNLDRLFDAVVTCLQKDAKTIASFVGKVESVVSDTAKVLLINEATNEQLDSQCDLEVLSENGVGEGDEFRCQVIRLRGTATVQLFKLPRKSVPKSRVDEVRAKHRGRWDF